ncbi:Scr1 family TA system antitoxin-like transcriptional regulator [Plantactinospora sp. BC1]|uniref:Scr1 family TA system antitoxin-like transcriptional regulator n=1 Tax=Plantactinospora sp. BC1 TaxID=2108470 RepID=UPI003511E0BA
MSSRGTGPTCRPPSSGRRRNPSADLPTGTGQPRFRGWPVPAAGDGPISAGSEGGRSARRHHPARLRWAPSTPPHVVPATTGLWLGQSGPFVIASFEEGPDVAFLEDHLQGRVVTDPRAVAALQRSWEIVRAVALPRDLSRDLILKLVNEL